MRKRSGQVHSRESSATLQLTVSLLYHLILHFLYSVWFHGIIIDKEVLGKLCESMAIMAELKMLPVGIDGFEKIRKTCVKNIWANTGWIKDF